MEGDTFCGRDRTGISADEQKSLPQIARAQGLHLGLLCGRPALCGRSGHCRFDDAYRVGDQGWVWLAKDKDGKLSITKEPNGSNPVVKGLTPIMGFDVWEHSYYLDYQNRRADHLNALWGIIDWETVGKRY